MDRALDSGIDVTHADSHMGTVFHLKFMEIYLQIALDYRVPTFIPRSDPKILEERGLVEHLLREQLRTAA